MASPDLSQHSAKELYPRGEAFQPATMRIAPMNFTGFVPTQCQSCTRAGNRVTDVGVGEGAVPHTHYQGFPASYHTYRYNEFVMALCLLN
uniref:Uncharacterized protein n=1 Tax=Globodera rostochiensis TaxID=31243 RepID=A0A914HK61_GLORO